MRDEECIYAGSSGKGKLNMFVSMIKQDLENNKDWRFGSEEI
jgi:hypothetical protein